MGGSVGKVLSPVARIGGDIATFGGNELLGNPLGNLANRATGNTGGIGSGSIYGGHGLFGDPNNSQYTSGPFSINPAQVAADQAAITALGNQQQQSTLNFNADDQAARAKARDALSAALTKQGQATFQQGLPATEETLNAQHLLNGSGLGQEIARQQGNLATNIANQVGVQGISDINRSSDLGLQALGQQQGAQTNALSRGFSLNDFINQANVAKTIGAQAAPQVGNGKGQTGMLLSGVGSVVPPVLGAFRGKGTAGQTNGVV